MGDNEPTRDELIAFLNGEGPLDGCWFGDGTRPPFTSSRPYWWREYLHVLREKEPSHGG